MATASKKAPAKKAAPKKPVSRKGIGGQPTKLDAERTKKLTDALKVGMYMETAAAVSGITAATVYNWKAKGKRAQELADLENREMTPTERKYFEFFEAVEIAEAAAEAAAIATVKQNIQAGDTKSAQWFLQHRYPTRWGRADRMTIEGGDRPIEVSVSITDVQAKVIQLLQKRGALEIENVEDAEVVE